MATKKRGLGRGLNALLAGNETVEAMTTPQRNDELKEIDVDRRIDDGNPAVHRRSDSLEPGEPKPQRPVNDGREVRLPTIWPR